MWNKGYRVGLTVSVSASDLDFPIIVVLVQRPRQKVTHDSGLENFKSQVGEWSS
jgi:hypothetical protein